MARDRLAELNSPPRARTRQTGRNEYIPLQNQNDRRYDDGDDGGYDDGGYGGGRYADRGGRGYGSGRGYGGGGGGGGGGGYGDDGYSRDRNARGREASSGRRMASQPGRATPPRRDYRSSGQSSSAGSGYAPAAPAFKMPPQPDSTVENTDVFFKEVSTINDLLKRVKDNVTRLEGVRAPQFEDDGYGGQVGMGRGAQRQADNITEETRVIMDALKTRIKAIELENARLPPNHPDMAIRTSQHGQMKKKFLDFLLMYNEVEREYSSQVKQQMERQIRIGNPDFTDEDVQDALEQQMDGQMLTQQMANQGGRYAGASAALQEVQARQNDMMKIEQTIIQLTQLFTEMSTLVEAQGQTIATIEQHVESTEQYTEQAVEEIAQAVVTAKRVRSNKWKLLVLCILLFVIAGVLLYLFVLKDFINGLFGGNNGGAAKATPSSTAARTRAVVQAPATTQG